MFSLAHTRAGQYDDTNEATFLAIEGIVKRSKPRIVILEETFGLTRTEVNKQWFTIAVHVLTKLGFSVR